MKIKMLHVCIRVKDLEKSLEFYKNGIGLIETRKKDFPEHGFTLVYLSDEDKAYELELTYNYDQAEPYELGNGYSHIAVAVEDLEEARKTHEEMGYQVTKIVSLPSSKTKYYFVIDPDGYKVEIIG